MSSAPAPPAPLPQAERGEGRTEWIMLGGLVLLALALRLLVWRWRDQYPLGGDEQEYLQQALTLLQERRYVELRLMRPPLYTLFLAGSIQLVDSLVQNLRLVQALLSSITVIPVALLTRALFGWRAALIAGLLTALSYTLAAAATELLTETVFLLGLACVIWLLVLAHSQPRRRWLAVLAGLAIGALTLVRSVALPLIPLGALWLLTCDLPLSRSGRGGRGVRALLVVLGALALIAPWSIRNTAAYGGIILVDTTGAENLWLDNDPAGREAVKAQLYALGEDRLARQRLATARGIAVIAADPARFTAKAWLELQRFFALQHFDDLRDRPAIWVPPAEVWLRLLLGDALWLLILLAGSAGLWLAPRTGPDLRWVAVPWALYTILTACIFHVELRYRLPLLPVLLPFAAWLLTTPLPAWERGSGGQGVPRHGVGRARWLAGGATLAALVLLTCAIRPYPTEAIMLARKHMALALAQRALDLGDAAAAHGAASQALQLDDRSALARVALARAALLDRQPDAALTQLDAATRAIAAHPHPHLLRGAILLSRADPAAASDLAYERASLEDLQWWAWRVFPTTLPAPAQIDLGGGADLGHIRGFHLAEDTGSLRWTTGRAELRLRAPAGEATLRLRLAPGRPPEAPAPQLVVLVGGVRHPLALQPGWQIIEIPVAPAADPEGLLVVIESDTFIPRGYDRASADGRALGVQLDWAEVAVGGAP
jgi:4-amino-4-deoxy-L-arabinose transferase-like glycosyltransferase